MGNTCVWEAMGEDEENGSVNQGNNGDDGSGEDRAGVGGSLGGRDQSHEVKSSQGLNHDWEIKIPLKRRKVEEEGDEKKKIDWGIGKRKNITIQDWI